MPKNTGQPTQFKPKTGGTKKVPPIEAPPTIDQLGISKNDSSLWQKVATIPATTCEKKMTCPRCANVLLHQEYPTHEGRWRGLGCLACGYIVGRLMLKHRKHRPEPFKTVPLTKAKRPSFPTS